MYHLKAGAANFEAEIKKGTISLNGNTITPSAYKLPNGDTHLIINNKGYTVEQLGWNETHDALKLRVNGKLIEVEAKSELTILLQKMGMGIGTSSKANDIKAPMPGLIVAIKVDVGMQVQKGQVLVVLEAMKMENAIKATGDGVVKRVTVSTGDKVEKNAVLVEFS
ncbi:MAG: acetyl-CoA carboxylase biotin carboxyl carrier protein subunit [Flexibacteraceae bacterium]|jgi:acetyl/propionyl-CoA carboxylase alpha subunit